MKNDRGLSAFPTGIFVLIVAVVCLGLAASAGHDYFSLSGLRIQTLNYSATEIASALDVLARGPNRSDPGFWQNLFAERIAGSGATIAYLNLLDDQRKVLASAGLVPTLAAGQTGLITDGGQELFVYDAELPMPRMGPGSGGRGPGMNRGGGMGMIHRDVPRRLRIGLFASSAGFIRWQALTHLAINGIAILTLIALAAYFLHTLHRFLQLQTREESARHLTALGSLAATLAHEIRNPLGAMKGLTQLAQEDLPGDHKTQALMSTVVKEAERLEQLVTDLLTFARPRDPQISRFDFHQLLLDIQSGLQPRLDHAQIKLAIESGSGLLEVESDEGGLRQILLNVLLNAIDATPAGETIVIRTRSDERAHMLITEVDDRGPGLNGREPEDFFQPFATTKTKGTGLGLPIFRQIAERLGGSLVLASRPEGGARCTLRLPLVRQ